MANNNNEEPSNHAACAACKYQRKKCAANCILRRHFPASNIEAFAAVHKIFGVANVTKMMREANSPADQDEIAKSLYWEAATWVQDPVRGPYGAHLRLQDEVRVLREHVNQQRILLMHNTNTNINAPTINNFHGNMNMNMNMMVNTNSNGNFRRPLLYSGPTRQFQEIGINEGHDYVDHVSNNNQQSMIRYVPVPRVSSNVSSNVIGPGNNVRVTSNFGDLDSVTWQQQNYRNPKHDKMQ